MFGGERRHGSKNLVSRHIVHLELKRIVVTSLYALHRGPHFCVTFDISMPFATHDWPPARKVRYEHGENCGLVFILPYAPGLS